VTLAAVTSYSGRTGVLFPLLTLSLPHRVSPAQHVLLTFNSRLPTPSCWILYRRYIVNLPHGDCYSAARFADLSILLQFHQRQPYFAAVAGTSPSGPGIRATAFVSRCDAFIRTISAVTLSPSCTHAPTYCHHRSPFKGWLNTCRVVFTFFEQYLDSTFDATALSFLLC